MVMRHKVLATLAAAIVMAGFVPTVAGAVGPQPQLAEDDWEAPVVYPTDDFQVGDLGSIQGLFDEDPTGLVPKTPFVQRYSLDQDHWEVWLCGDVSPSMPEVLAALEAATVDYFDSISGGVYEPVFTAGGTKPADEDCLPEFLNGTYTTVGSPEGVFIVDPDLNGGFASPGTICISSDPDCSWISSTFPGNYRYAVVGEYSVLNLPSITAHELGHTLQWPHSGSGGADDYDNPLDLMSGNVTTGGWTEADPYATLSYSRLQSGWVAAGDVVVADGAYQAVTLQPHNAAGTQLFAIETAQAGRFYVFGARTTSTFDPIPSAWQGVEVYEVDYYCDDGAFGGGICPGIYRAHTQLPPSPNGVGHVLQVGEGIVVEGLTVTVTAASGAGYTITADPNPGVDTEPSAPGTPTATGGDEQATLVWSAAGDGGSPILNYDVEVENRDGGGSTTTDVGVTLSTTATGLSNGTSYRARVRATNAIGDGPWSAWSAEFTPGTVPGTPGTPTLSAAAASVNAAWTAPDDEGGAPITNYELQLEDQAAGVDTFIDAGAGLGEDIDGLVNGHSYRVRVRAESSLGSGAWSGWSAAAIPLATPSAPQAPSVAVSAVGEAAASWTPPADNGGSAISGFELVLENTSTGGSVVHDPGTATTFDFVGLIATDTYRYRVRAENSVGWSAWSAWSPDFIPDTVPGAPGVPSLTAGDAQLTATWLATGSIGSPVDAYELEISGTNATVSVGAAPLSYTFTGLVNGDGYEVRVRAHNDTGWGPWSAWSDTATPMAPPNRFSDDDGSVFEADIEWLAAEGVTKGCNPPVNDMFCPDAPVTRGQMAAFLVRALDLTDRLEDPFVDDNGSIFEADIEKLAAAGITRGCNPPTNDRFCPDAPVTREQMAAFLVRALGYTDTGAGDLFSDDDGSIFETAIDKLATAGVTRGCNPPTNDLFCPANVVTRGQMAAFLHRALG